MQQRGGRAGLFFFSFVWGERKREIFRFFFLCVFFVKNTTLNSYKKEAAALGLCPRWRARGRFLGGGGGGGKKKGKMDEGCEESKEGRSDIGFFFSFDFFS